MERVREHSQLLVLLCPLQQSRKRGFFSLLKDVKVDSWEETGLFFSFQNL